jgi:hypothetical protein
LTGKLFLKLPIGFIGLALLPRFELAQVCEEALIIARRMGLDFGRFELPS